VTEIPAGIRNCTRLPQAIDVPVKLDEKSPSSLLVPIAKKVSRVLEECGQVGLQKNHNAHCPPLCEVKNVVEPLAELLRKAKD